MIGSISTMAAATIINVAFPALIREFSVGHDSLQWIATGFLAATTTTMLATAWLVETLRPAANIHAHAAAVPGGIAARRRQLEHRSADRGARAPRRGRAASCNRCAMIVLFEVFPPSETRRGDGHVRLRRRARRPRSDRPSAASCVEAFGWRSIFLMPVPFCVVAIAMALRYLSVAGCARSAPRLRLDRHRAPGRRPGRAAQRPGDRPSLGMGIDRRSPPARVRRRPRCWLRRLGISRARTAAGAAPVRRPRLPLRHAGLVRLWTWACSEPRT